LSSAAELCVRLVRLGSASVVIGFPLDLATWFDGLTERPGDAAVPEITLRHAGRRFTVATRLDGEQGGFDLGEALALLWERVSYTLVDATRDGLALHAAAARRGGDVVAILGESGAGKTHLANWYATQGFDLGTDEITVFSAASPATGQLTTSTLARPLILKQSAAFGNMAGNAGFFGGGVVPPSGLRGWSGLAIDRALVLVVKYAAGSSLELRPLTPGETGLAILGHCLNVRNLEGGGLPLAAALGRGVQAVALTYGSSAQLDGTLDVLTRQLFASALSRRDLAALCRAFTSASDGGTAASGTVATVPAKRPVPAPTLQRFSRRLTVGLATYDDYDGAYFTVQALRLGNPAVADDLEFVIIDNNPGGPCSEALSHLANSFDGCRYLPRGDWNGTAIRNAVFEEASSPFVLCLDSHVLVEPGSIVKLVDYFEASPKTRDLLQGPMLLDNLRDIYTHMDQQWRGGMLGTWASDERGKDPAGDPFDIPLHGLGLFAARKAAWVGFSSAFRGFGGEEGYIHEKTRQAGGRTLCLPFLRWVHRFQRPMGIPYRNIWEDRMRNYVIGFAEVGWDRAPMEQHFGELLGGDNARRIFAAIDAELGAAARERPQPAELALAVGG